VDERELVFTRLFDAPRDLVFQAWSDPDRLSQWWGPRGFTTTTHEWDFHAGGTWRFTMHGPDGVDYPNRIVFQEVNRPSRLAYRHAGEEGEEDVSFGVTVDFAEESGKTRLTMRMVFDTAEELRKVAEEYGAVEGAHQTMDRLQELLATVTIGEPGAFVISRVFKAPRELVFRAWTEREHLMQWFGPKGFTMFACNNELRPGGVMHYGLRGPNGNEMWGRWVYRDVVPPERLSFVTSFSDPGGGVTRAPFSDQWPLEVLSVIDFTEQDGRTTVTMRGRAINASEPELGMFESFFSSMQKGWSGTFDQLAEHLAKTTGTNS
jgi:uncharacterized protein YndB with AHSA1/START domain